MIKKIILILFISLIFETVIAQTNKQIEIFDISKGEVLKYIKVNIGLQQDAETFLKGITGLYVRIDPIPSEGYLVKIPLDPSFLVKNQWINELVDEVIIVFSTREAPYLMVFDKENRPLFFTFEGDTDTFLTKLNFTP
ncbi:hypothetical protein [Chengkuizengella sediminis]|uniref:hypothetical protein n=1 Tax=Chengkuizengella sediminis TaxID=1885917 RepID=UPI00138951C6|nr:hypothetical protein [Chengkuizengella sediminis]NDI34410.1 hypothetical protein [Chengkuizengella sediminis]